MYTVSNPIYRCRYLICIQKPKEKVQKHFSDAIENYGEDADAQVYYEKDLIALCFHSPSYANIAHEVTHAVNRTFQYIGYVIETDNDEVSAYMVEWLYDEVLKIFKKENKLKLLKR